MNEDKGRSREGSGRDVVLIGIIPDSFHFRLRKKRVLDVPEGKTSKPCVRFRRAPVVRMDRREGRVAKLRRKRVGSEVGVVWVDESEGRRGP